MDALGWRRLHTRCTGGVEAALPGFTAAGLTATLPQQRDEPSLNQRRLARSRRRVEEHDPLGDEQVREVSLLPVACEESLAGAERAWSDVRVVARHRYRRARRLRADFAFIVAMSVPGKEPAFDGEADTVLAYFSATRSTLARFRSYLVVVGMVAMIWFAIGLALLLGRAEGRPAWRSSVAAASALVFVGRVLHAPGEAASYRAQTLTPELATYAFDVGNLGFANGWVTMGSFLLCAGWAMISTRFAPSWLGWLAVAGGVGLVLSRAMWTSPIWLLPYASFGCG
jgi:hypothetical protein